MEKALWKKDEMVAALEEGVAHLDKSMEKKVGHILAKIEAVKTDIEKRPQMAGELALELASAMMRYASEFAAIQTEHDAQVRAINAIKVIG